MESEQNKAIVRKFVEALNAQEWDRLDELVASDFQRFSRAAGSPAVGSLDDLKRYFQSELETFPDARETIEDILAEGDKVAVPSGTT